MIAALFVATGGAYFNLPDVDPWDEKRDARLYTGPHPVVAHPPCERWGRYWSGGPMLAGTPRAKLKGDDGGCFAAALEAVRRWGGVLEHPEASHAFAAHGLAKPERRGGWSWAGDGIGFVCCVEQGHYGHRARKATWLYVAGVPDQERPALMWGPTYGLERLDEGFHSTEERLTARAAGVPPRRRLSTSDNLRTPVAFRDLLIAIARSATAGRVAA